MPTWLTMLMHFNLSFSFDLQGPTGPSMQQVLSHTSQGIPASQLPGWFGYANDWIAHGRSKKWGAPNGFRYYDVLNKTVVFFIWFLILTFNYHNRCTEHLWCEIKTKTHLVGACSDWITLGQYFEKSPQRFALRGFLKLLASCDSVTTSTHPCVLVI